MMMQWFVNEVREKFEQLSQRVEGLARSLAEDRTPYGAAGNLPPPVMNEKVDVEYRVTKLEGELKAMKARMGKQKQE